jgi:hypothetical protein
MNDDQQISALFDQMRQAWTDGDAVAYGRRFTPDVESIRHLGDGVAVMHATGSVLVAWRRRLPKRRLTRNTIVVVRGPEGWRCAAIHNGRVRPVGVPGPDSVPARVARSLVRASRALHLGHPPAAPAAAGR